MISVGGVLLAILILALALSPPGGSNRQFASLKAPARGALIDLGEHPEWRQFLILAAIRRAGEVERLRELPDTPVRLPEIPELAPVEFFEAASKNGPEVAGLPADRIDSDPDDETGSFNVAPGPTIPIEIGEPSSTELPVLPVEENSARAAAPANAEPPAAVKPAGENRQKIVQPQRPRAATQARAQAPAQTEAPIPFNLLQAFFDSLLNGRPASAAKPAVASAARQPATAKRPAPIRSVSQ